MRAKLLTVESNQDSRGSVIRVYEGQGLLPQLVLRLIDKTASKKTNADVYYDAQQAKLSKLDIEEKVSHKFRVRNGLAVELSFAIKF